MEQIADFMAKDHDRLDSLFAEFKGKKHRDFPGARALFYEFHSGLIRHIAWEEELLFPRFEERTGMRDTGPTAVMRMEHRQVKGFLEQIRNQLAAGDAQTDEQEGGLKAVLTEHNQKEEAVLYPWMDRSLTETEVREILEKMRNRPQGRTR